MKRSGQTKHSEYEIMKGRSPDCAITMRRASCNLCVVGEQILFQFVPTQLVYSLKFSSGDHGGLFVFACPIYNRILLPVDQAMSHQVILNSLRTCNFFKEPAFSLTQPLHTKGQFVRQFPALSLDIID